MKNIFLNILILNAAILSLSCERESSVNLDPNFNAPYLFSVNLDNTILNLDADTSGSVDSLGDNSYRISVIIEGKALRRSSDAPSHAVIKITKPEAASPFTQRTAAAEGSDTIVFSKSITFDILRSEVGFIRFEAFIQTVSGLIGNSVISSLLIVRKNSRPEIRGIYMPDSVTVGALPSLDSTFLVAAEAADSDGITDIYAVQFQSVKPDGNIGNCGLSVPLFDDGSQYVVYGGRSGDAVAGDAIFSLKIPLYWRTRNNCPPPDSVETQRGIYKFIFSAIDNSGAESDTVIHLLNVK